MTIKDVLVEELSARGFDVLAGDAEVIDEDLSGRIHRGRYRVVTGDLAVVVVIRLHHDAQGTPGKRGVEYRELPRADRTARLVERAKQLDLTPLGATASAQDAALETALATATELTGAPLRRLSALALAIELGLVEVVGGEARPTAAGRAAARGGG